MPLHLAVAVLPAIAAFASGSIAIYAWQRRETNGARTFSLCTGSIFVWCFLSVFEQLSQSAVARVAFGRLQYSAITCFCVSWLIFTLQYAQCDGWLNRRNVAKISAVPGLTFLLALTDHWHRWIWQSAELIADPFPHLKLTYGWWFLYVWMPYGYLLLIAGAGVLLYAAFSGSQFYRKQTLFLLSSALLSFGCNVLYVISGVTIYGLDPTPIGFGLGALLCHFGLFKAGFLDIVPISYRTVFLNTAEGVILIDRYRRIVDLNPSALLESGRNLSMQQVLGKPFEQVFPLYGCVIKGRAEQPELNETVQVQGKLPERRIKGTMRPAFREVKVRSLRSPGGRLLGQVIIIRDITIEQQQQLQLEQLVYLDSLTGVYNRRHLEDRIRKMLNRAIATKTDPESTSPLEPAKFALLYLDLNRFKPINDTYGHEVGDAALQHFARCVERSVRKGDVVARLGGDEFVALLSHAGEAAAIEVRSRLAKALNRPVIISGQRLNLSASIGVAYYPKDGSTLKTLLRRADRRMYVEKQRKQKVEKGTSNDASQMPSEG